MSTAKQLRRLVDKLSRAEREEMRTGAWLTLRDGRYGVAFYREFDGEPETLVEFDLLKLAEELEGRGDE